MLKITLFNQFTLSLDDQPLRPSLRPKTLELWAYLLLHHREPVLRQTVAFALWPDTDDKTALTNCRRHLHHLKSLLDEIEPDTHWLDIDNKSVMWRPDAPVWVDVDAFHHWSENDATLADAVALYTGDLLQELYADWLFYERERYREYYLASLHRLVENCAALRDYPAAIQYAQQLLTSDPFREATIRQLMRLLYQSGDRAGALAVYQDFIKQLRQELNVEPMDQTTELYQNILSNRLQVTRESATVIETALDARLPFAGRDNAMQTLRVLWNRAATGKGQVVFVGGAAGMGKSRLIDELRLLAEGQGALALRGGTSFLEALPQQAFVEAITPVLPALVAAVEDVGSLAALTPFIAELPQHHPPLNTINVTAQPQVKQDVFAAFSTCFIALSHTRPLLLLLEDFHWALPYTVELLDHLIRATLHRPLLIVVTYRPEDTARNTPLRDLLRRLRRESISTHMTLDAIGADAIQSMLTRLFGAIDELDTMTATLLQVSDGNPLFIHELLQNYLETGVIHRQATGWHIQSDAGGHMPARIQTIIGERLARLSADARSLIEIAAVIGVAFDLELIREVSGWGDDLLFDGLHELLDRGIIRESSGQGAFDYTFTHHLIRQTVYDLLDDSTHRRRHRRTARIMHEIYGEDQKVSLLLAQHYDFGGVAEEAANFYLIAARRDHALYANAEALGYIERALTLTKLTTTRFDLLCLRENIESVQANHPAQARTIVELEALAGQDNALLCLTLMRSVRYLHSVGSQQEEYDAIARLEEIAADGEWQAKIPLLWSLYHLRFDDYNTAQTLARQALTQSIALESADDIFRSYAALTEIALHRGDFEAANAYIQQAKDNAADRSHIAMRLHYLKHAGTRAFMAQQYQASMGFFEDLLADSLHYTDKQSEMVANLYLAMNHARLANSLLADKHYDRTSALVQVHGSDKIKLALRINRGAFKAATGQIADAMREFEDAKHMMTEAGDRRGVYTCVLNLSVLHLWLEDAVTALHFAEQALTLADELDSVAYRADALSSIGFAQRASGNYPAAIDYLQKALALRGQMSEQQTSRIEDAVELAVVYLEADQRDEAAHLLDDILPRLADADHSAYNFQRVLWHISHLCGEFGYIEQAAALLEKAHDRLNYQLQQLPEAQQEAYRQLPFNRAILNAIQA